MEPTKSVLSRGLAEAFTGVQARDGSIIEAIDARGKRQLEEVDGVTLLGKHWDRFAH